MDSAHVPSDASCVDSLDVVFLHGFGDMHAAEGLFVRVLSEELQDSNVHLHAPSYHPNGDVSKTRLNAFLGELEALAKKTSRGRFAAIFGFSVGGLVAALFQEGHPDLVDRIVLLAPAIDNFARNFADAPPDRWHMPSEYVEELRSLSARPVIRVPAVLVHGELESDAGGSAPWRIREWAESEAFEACFYPRGVGHSPSVVGADGSPSWPVLTKWAISGEPLL